MEKPQAFVMQEKRTKEDSSNFMIFMERNLVASYQRILGQCLDKAKTLDDFERNVISFKKVGLIPKFLETKFIDMKISFIHQAFAKELSN